MRKVSSSRRSKNDEIFDSDDNDVIVPIRKRMKRFIIVDESSEEENIKPKWNGSWDWKETNNVPIIWNYSQSCGIKDFVLNQLSDDHGVLELFFTVFDENFWNLLVTQTNLYADQIMSNERKRRKMDDTWFSVTQDEMKAYYALCILMTQVKKSNVQMYWSKREVIQTPIFGKIMPFKRFRQISRFLHFSDNETTESNDCFQKANTGFCCNFQIYTDQDKNQPNDTASQNVVMELMKSVINKGHTLFLDKWYSSPALFLQLRAQKTNVIGTVRSNKQNMPKNLAINKLKRGEYLYRTCNGLLALRWKDKRDDYLLSTKHTMVELTEVTRKQHKKTLKPNCVIEYKKGMAGIKLQKQMLACFPIMRKFIKGYRKLFFYMSDMALFNTYIMKKKIYDQGKQTYVDYRINIAEAILQHVQLPDYTRRGTSSLGITPLRLQAQYWSHFPKHIDATPKRKHPSKTCEVCYKQNKRSATTWECTKCKIALHLPECFVKYGKELIKRSLNSLLTQDSFSNDDRHCERNSNKTKAQFRDTPSQKASLLLNNITTRGTTSTINFSLRQTNEPFAKTRLYPIILRYVGEVEERERTRVRRYDEKVFAFSKIGYERHAPVLKGKGQKGVDKGRVNNLCWDHGFKDEKKKKEKYIERKNEKDEEKKLKRKIRIDGSSLNSRIIKIDASRHWLSRWKTVRLREWPVSIREPSRKAREKFHEDFLSLSNNFNSIILVSNAMINSGKMEMRSKLLLIVDVFKSVIIYYEKYPTTVEKEGSSRRWWGWGGICATKCARLAEIRLTRKLDSTKSISLEGIRHNAIKWNKSCSKSGPVWLTCYNATSTLARNSADKLYGREGRSVDVNAYASAVHLVSALQETFVSKWIVMKYDPMINPKVQRETDVSGNKVTFGYIFSNEFERMAKVELVMVMVMVMVVVEVVVKVVVPRFSDKHTKGNVCARKTKTRMRMGDEDEDEDEVENEDEISEILTAWAYVVARLNATSYTMLHATVLFNLHRTELVILLCGGRNELQDCRSQRDRDEQTDREKERHRETEDHALEKLRATN
ncbi:piggyBac transposable element-derived protein 4-like [Vespula squamosa]|uniref:PiggyBac transposable element-derived protein 4-like n=1 Tax=Vespula squamosa TaxID=30214 RepID=A0ABD2AAH7_VESSQ